MNTVCIFSSYNTRLHRNNQNLSSIFHGNKIKVIMSRYEYTGNLTKKKMHFATILMLIWIVSTCNCFSILSTTRCCSHGSISNVVITSSSQSVHRRSKSTFTILSSNNDNNQEDEVPMESRLKQLGFTDNDIQRSVKPNDKEIVPVRVNLLPEVDPFTLTAVGFGLIAFNFFVLANVGDGGLAGLIASIINLSRQ